MRLSRRAEATLYAYFDQWPSTADLVIELANEVHCAHILVKTQKDAQAAMERLNKGEKFASIAGEISICPSRKRGGDLGTFGRGRMVKEFEQAAFALQKGQISPIVKTQFGYHIIRRLE